MVAHCCNDNAADLPKDETRWGTMLVSGRCLSVAILSMGMMAGCTSAQDMQTTSEALAKPYVVMEADPPPPFTYWAPDNSTIRNHPRVEGVWTAEIEGQPTRTYYGDQCRASEFQHFVGQPLEGLPEQASGVNWRMVCTETCAMTSDLRRERTNVLYDEKTRRIASISCG